MYKNSSEILKSLRGLDHLAELDRQVREIESEQQIPAPESIQIQSEHTPLTEDIEPIEPLPQFGQNALDLTRVETLSANPEIADDDSVATTISPPDIHSALEGLERINQALDTFVAQERLLNQGIAEINVHSYAIEIANTLNEQQLLDLINVNNRQRYLEKILIDRAYDRLIKVASEQVDKVHEHFIHSEEVFPDSLLDKAIDDHIKKVIEVAQLTGHDYVSQIHQGKNPPNDYNSHREFLKELALADDFLLIDELITGDTKLKDILLSVNIDHQLLTQLNRVIDQKIVAIIKAKENHARDKSEAHFLQLGMKVPRLARIDQQQHLAALRCDQIFKAFFPAAELPDHEFKKMQGDPRALYHAFESIPDPITALKRMLTDYDFKRNLLHSGYHTLKEKELSSTGRYQVLALLKEYVRCDMGEADKLRNMLAFIDALACKVYEQTEKLRVLTGKDDQDFLVSFFALAEHAALDSQQQNNKLIYIMIMLAKLIDILRRQEHILDSFEQFEQHILYKAKRYIRKLRHELSDHQAELIKLEETVYRTNPTRSIHFWPTTRKVTSLEDAARLIDSLEQKNRMLELKIERLKCASETAVGHRAHL